MTRSSGKGSRWARALAWFGRIRMRLLLVNALVVLVPIAGLEFARIYERQLLDGLQRDMRNQAVLMVSFLAADLARSVPLEEPSHEQLLMHAALSTRTRIRVLGAQGALLCDSHRNGPPEGPEPSPSRYSRALLAADLARAALRERNALEAERHFGATIAERREVKQALAGQWSASTRVARSPPAVFLFLAEPIATPDGIAGVVYVTRSTEPVLEEMHRIRSGLIRVLILALSLTALITFALSLTISRPLERLSQAARRIASGTPNVPVPIAGGGEISELGEAFAEMTHKLEDRHRYISQFAADVAHEFKSPLTSIRGAAELLAEGADDDPKARQRFLDNIALDAERLDRLVSRLLELSRIEASDVEPTLLDLEELALRTVARSQTPEGSVVLRYAARARYVVARGADLETALLNLLDNALRVSPPHGQVQVVVADQGPGSVQLEVIDQGPGILPENLGKVFDRFFTTDSEHEGTGLGLAIVKSVAEAHGGSVEVQSTPGQGACFRITLPSTSAASSRP